MLHYLVITLLLIQRDSEALPGGAPNKVCQTMLPFHRGGIPPQSSPSPFTIIPSVNQLEENGRMTVTVGSRYAVQFGGLLVQGRTELGQELIGTFLNMPLSTKPMDCSRINDSVTHNSPEKKGPLLDFEWQPPPGFKGIVIFNATVAQDYSTFWVGIESEPINVLSRSEITNPQSPNPYRPITNQYPFPQSTTPPYFTPNTQNQISQKGNNIYNGCNEVKGCFGAPDGCIHTRDCKALVTTTVRGDRYEFELYAPSEAAYVAVGLSDDNQMGDDSVVECVKQNNGAGAYMSRTIPRSNLNVQRLPRPKDGIQLQSYNVTNGELYCRIARDTITTVNGRTYDLANDQYFLLVASGRQASENKVGFHDIVYLPAAEKRYLSDISTIAGASKLLLRLHGAFMLAAWIGTASIGILLARYYRQTWVGRQICGKDHWFAWHRFFMICTWSLTITASVLIFVELKAWSSERNPHAILGVVTTVICFLQPIGAYFRPHPGTPRRPIFNWLHWLAGNVAHILAIVTIFFAVKLNKADLPEWMDWILVGYVAFHVLMHLILSLMSWLQILGCVSDRSAEGRITSFPMKDLNTNGRTSHGFDRRSDAPNSGARKFLLGLYIVVIVLFAAEMIVMIVLAPIEETWHKLFDSMSEKS